MSTATASTGTVPCNESVTISAGPSVRIALPATRVSSTRSGTVGTRTAPRSPVPAPVATADPAMSTAAVATDAHTHLDRDVFKVRSFALHRT
jgi:hypothetical protein